MKIAVFGTGIVGQVIGSRLAGLGHSVTIGTREVAKTLARTERDMYGNPPFREWQKLNNVVALASFKQAAADATIIFNCTSGQSSVAALMEAGEENLRGKIIIDIANPLDFSKGMPPTLSPGNTDSLGELIQRTFPDTKVVKTLNTMNCVLMANPVQLAGDHNVFMSGNDEGAKSIARDILKSFGWLNQNIIDLGDITTARGTEQLLPIWIRLYGALKTPMFNFKIVLG